MDDPESAEDRQLLDLSPGERRLVRFTLVAFTAVALAGLAVAGIWVLGQIISALHLLVFPLAVAGVLALVFSPVIAVLQRYARLPRLAAVVTLFVLLFLLLAGILLLIVPTAVNQGAAFVNAIPDMAERGYTTLSNKLPRLLPMIEDAAAGLDFAMFLPEAGEAADVTMDYVGLVVGMGFVPLYLFFALLVGSRINESFKKSLFLFNHETQNEVLYLGQVFVSYVTAFFRGQLAIALIMGVIMATGFTIVGLEGAIFFGLALGLLNIVPYLGTVLGIATVLPIAYIQPDGGLQLVALVGLVIALAQGIDAILLTPKIMADRSGLHPVVVVVSILFWGTVLGGVVGMILAVPLTAFLLTLGQHIRMRYSKTIHPDRMHKEWKT
ncbi:AI-2E family transporter [Aquisalimonas sp.]|uniref:AI-2E family transporter n=1 Tax=Aquisalimonas sp. TaxID=1872621 RepID=UPI0025BB69AB|nr:AI-2E family transporter [Aquisalimonas sp.]